MGKRRLLKFLQFCLFSLFELPLLILAPIAPTIPLKVTVQMPGQSAPIGLANQFLGGKPQQRPEDRIMNYHLGMSQMALRKKQPAIPTTRIQEAAILRQQKPILDRIQNVANQLNRGEVTPGELLHKMQNGAKLYSQGKSLNSAVAEGKLTIKPTGMDKHAWEKEKRKKEEKEIALAVTKVALERMKEEKKKAVEEAIKVMKKEMNKQKLRNGGHKGHKGHKGHHQNGGNGEKHELRKANQKQAGFMAIVMHKLVQPPAEMLRKNSRGAIPTLRHPKDVHNLLWTAVSLAREQLAMDKAKTPLCLLEFLARMVGGAFAPFIDRKNEKYMNGQHGFLHKIRHYEVAFLSSGYKAFWREKLGKTGFEEYEKRVHPVFINHEF